MLGLATAFASGACGDALTPREGGVMPGATCDASAQADVPPIPADAFFDDTSNCHLVGCVDIVALAMIDAQGHEIDVFHADAFLDDVPVSIDCDGSGIGEPTQCIDRGRIEFDGAPRHVDLVVTTPDGRGFHGCVVPEYTLHQPNGPGCPDICRFALAQITLR